jgi:hypothetical protein
MMNAAGSPKAWGFANRPHGELALDKDLVNGKETLALNVSMKDGWHPPGTNRPEATIAHEFGHHLDFRLMASDGNAGWSKMKGENDAAMQEISRYADHGYYKYQDESWQRSFGHDARYLEPVAEGFSQYEAKQSGYFKGELKPGAALIGAYLKDKGIGRHV